MQRNTNYLVLLIGIMSLMACTIKTQPGMNFTGIDLGINTFNETCQLKTASMLYDAVEMSGALFNIYCGDWEWPSARIFKIDTDSSAASSWLGDNVWRRTLERRMSCVGTIQNKRSLPLQNSDIIVQQCKLNNGGWPYLALIIQLKGSTYLADGIPSALLSIEQAIATLAGIDKISPATQSAAKEYLQQQYKNKMYSTNDLQAYYRAITLGQYFNSIKAFSKAEAQYWQALKRHQQVLGTDNSDIGDVLIHIALELSNQEQFVRADDMFVKADDKFNIVKSRDDDSRYISYQALHLANQGEFQFALQMAVIATQQRHEKGMAPAAGLSGSSLLNQSSPLDYSFMGLSGLQSAPAEVVQSLYIEAAMQERLGRNKESKLVLERAQYILSSAGEAPPLWEPQIGNLGGLIATLDQQQIHAEKSRTKALGLFEERVPQKRPTLLSRIDLGKLYLNQQRNDEAIIQFREAIDLAKKRSNSFRMSQLEPYFTFQLGSSYTREEETSREMFEAAQLVQSGITAKEIARTVARFGKKAQEQQEREEEQHKGEQGQQDSLTKNGQLSELIGKLQKQEYKRAKKQQQYQAELGHLLEPDHLQRLEKLTVEFDNIDQEIEQLNQQLLEVSPGFRQFINSAVNAEDVINALAEDEALLQVLTGKHRTYVFFIHDKKVQAYSVPVPTTEITSTVGLLRRTIAKKDREIFQAADRAHGLYKKLFGPISNEIDKVSHLITVPSGPLLSFPFGLFVTKPPLVSKKYSNAELAKIAWLVKSTSISLVPSAQSFVYLREHASPSTATKSLIAFGDFVPFGNEKLQQHQRQIPVCQVIGEEAHFYFAELAGTRQEIKKVAAKFPSVSEDDLFLKTRFTEEAVKSQNLKDYRIIYFATHALLPDQIDCRGEPSLITSINTAEEGGDDGFLTASEISELDLNADLVVLSACNTSGAYQAQGESLSGLARVFFFAGTRSLLVSHWPVHDEATAELMILVFSYLENKSARSVANALRQAKLKMLKKSGKLNWAHPYYWAGFSLVGDGSLSIATDGLTASR